MKIRSKIEQNKKSEKFAASGKKRSRYGSKTELWLKRLAGKKKKKKSQTLYIGVIGKIPGRHLRNSQGHITLPCVKI